MFLIVRRLVFPSVSSGTLDSKYDAVISDLEKLYGDPLYSSFDLYVTGHRYE